MMNWKLNQRKGNVVDVAIFFPIAIFMIGLMLLIGYNLLSQFTTEIENDPDFNYTDATDYLNDSLDRLTVFDYGIFMLMFAITLVGIISGYNIKSYPVICLVAILICIISSILLAYISNIFEEIGILFPTALSNFPILNYLMQYYPYFFAIMIVITIIVTYAKGD